ncbi:unnamed protein product [Knipowitschia caucasica]
MEPLQRVTSDQDSRLQDQRTQSVTDSKFLQNSSQFALQDSNLSPALSLLPSESGLDHNIDFSLFQRSDREFAPLSACLDISVASETFQIPPHEVTAQILDQASLSQHPLAPDTTVLSGEAGSSCCALSQHSLSPDVNKIRDESVHLAPITEEEQSLVSKVIFGRNLEKVEDTYFLNKNIAAQQLMQTLQKDVGVPSSSSCSSHSSLKKSTETTEPESTDKLNHNLIREGPPGEATVSQNLPKPSRNSYIKDLKINVSEDSNVSFGSRCTKPDDVSEDLRQELLDIQRRNSRESEQDHRDAIVQKEYATPFPTRIPQLRNLVKANFSGALSTGSLSISTGIPQRINELRELDIASSGNQSGIDGSYLGLLPQSQSTPGVFKAPSKSNVKSKFQQLSDIESNKESSIQASTETFPPSNSAPKMETKSDQEPTRDKVQSLPSLNYMQKVDAWRANQSSGNSSLSDSLALHGFTGVSPKKNAYDAVSDSLNRILSQQVGKISQNDVKNPPADFSAVSSPRREEAVGSAPSENMATTQASPFNRSQSHSSLSTVVMSVKKEKTSEQHKDKIDTEELVIQQGDLSPVVISLGQFSDVTLSNSQDSSNSGNKVATSIGTSSISLEVDNYDPYWTGKASTPPPQHKPRELNIEERIPLYLQNLGINQSPSTILTPFAPRGPIREPEFSPTELGTIKGSTPTKSIQPSEDGTPHKAEFSRSSLQSVNSSVSVALSTKVIVQDLFRPTSPSSSEEESSAVQLKLPSHTNEDSSSQQKTDSIQNPEADNNLLQQGSSAEQIAEISFVSSGAFSDIRKLLNQANDIMSPRISTASETFQPQTKEAPLTSAFTAEESNSQNSHLWTRSSSDSVLTTRERLTGGEIVQPARQSGVVSRSAGLSLVLNKSVQRSEPEGCSAAPPDQVQVQLSPLAAAIETTVPEESKEAVLETSKDSPVQSSISSPAPLESLSDSSSQSSLAIRVAKLLQTESPATMVSSTNSVDQEEGRAREWIKLMISGQKCEPLELDQEDRRRIEEIKSELLLKNPKLGYASTDTESSAASSLRDPKGPISLHQIDAHKSKIPEMPPDQPKSLSRADDIIESKVREIAEREGINLPKPLTSITISTSRRSNSPPCVSPAPSKSPNSEPMHVNQLTEDNSQLVRASLDKNIKCQRMDEMAAESQKLSVRQETVGGHLDFVPVPEQDKMNKDNRKLLKKPETMDSSQAEHVAVKSGHVSQVRLLLSPKPMDHSSSAFTRDVSLPQRHFVPLRHSPSTPSSPDEGVGLSSPPEWQEVPKRGERFESNRRFMHQLGVTSAIRTSPQTVDAAIVPHLLPYKPNGSEELFYVPQTEADSSNDTTMESTHTGSDDALPPRFSNDVLGHQDRGLDRGVTLRHSEGIYSKRLHKAGVSMSQQQQRDAVNYPLPLGLQLPQPSSPALTRKLSPDTELPTASRRDQGTSPLSFLIHQFPKTQDSHKHHHPDPIRNQPPSSSKRNISDLDQLWERFSERWRREEESRPVRESEVSLLERLERLSQVIHGTRDSSNSHLDLSNQDISLTSINTGLRELKRQKHRGRSHVSFHDQRDDTGSGYGPDLELSSPAERDVSVVSVSSTSVSTVDTARLIRAFGPERIQRNLRSSSSLSKLYSAISKQKEQEQQNTATTETSTEDSSVVGSASSNSSYKLPPHRGPSKSLVSRKAVKLVSKGIQAGDLEIVSNGTRRHTRDVGTTFPSPGDVRGLRGLDRRSASSKKHESQSSPSKPYPHGVSWFISADELKAEARKENEPEDWRPSTVWFELLSRKPVWREPLRQRPVEEQRNTLQTENEPRLKGKTSSAVSRANLQDALLSGRPDFVARSRQRLERLALQAEERRLQALFQQERDELFIQAGGARRLPRPAGIAQLRRAVPRKEMFQRSKQIYENLPEVRRRREEQRRKAEYSSYRLNAQLYNKRITNHVLSRRSAWS